MSEHPSDPIRLDYELTELDVHHYCSAGRIGKVGRACRGRIVALLWLGVLGSLLVGLCFHSQGVRSGSLALGTTLAIVALLAWAREAGSERGVCRLARLLGIPRRIELVASPGGLAEGTEPARTFGWPEVVEVSRVDHLTVIRLRPAGSVLIVPDRAFASPQARSDFETSLGSWRDAVSVPMGGRLATRRGPPG